jgi:2'-hydroxyisoflavone reductase
MQEVYYLDENFLIEHGVNPWMGPDSLPLWLSTDPNDKGAFQLNVQKALEAGLKIRPLEETIRDTLEWAHSRGLDHDWKSGLTMERETELLEASKQK